MARKWSVLGLEIDRIHSFPTTECSHAKSADWIAVRVDEAAGERSVVQSNHVDHVKVQDVENLERFVDGDRAKKSSVKVVGHVDDLAYKI